MIVTACTIDCHPQENLADGGHDVVKFVGAGKFAISRRVIEDSKSIEASRGHCFIGDFVQFITGNLLTNELIVWLVVVERFDNVIPILPGERLQPIHFIAIRLSVAHKIEPVPSPALAIVV